MSDELRMSGAVHIVCSTYNGAKFLPQFLESVQKQSVSNWILWMRDDGSTDDSANIARAFAGRDERIRVLDSTGQLGVVAAFDWLLQRVPDSARYVMFADQDDVWLPVKIEYSLSAMMLGEETFSGPLLVHTDVVVVSETLAEIAPSFWEYARINAERNELTRLAVHNVVTGATMMINRALRERVGVIPIDAAMHDWWIACVASAFGRIIAVSTPTMLYRQHATNAIGAHDATLALSAGSAAAALGRSTKVRKDIARAARQAEVFLRVFGEQLPASDRTFLADYARIPAHGFLRRKLEIVRLHLHRENGWLRNAGLLVRA